MVEKEATVRNRYGIHCRPSAVIIKAIKEYGGEILVSAESGEANLRSVFDLISLGLAQGAQCTIRVSGPDEESVCEHLVELFETDFDFPRDGDPS